jgi:sugar lactone lactonase YvrE
MAHSDYYICEILDFSFMKYSFLLILSFIFFLQSCKEETDLVITGFGPSYGRLGTTVVIYGNNFSSNSNDNVVLFNGVQAKVSSASKTSLSVIVPNNATTGRITVRKNNETATSQADFLVNLTPIIRDFIPKKGAPGTLVEIQGEGFSTVLDEINVHFGSAKAVIKEANENLLKVYVPSGAVSQVITVIIYRQTDIGQVNTGTFFQVLSTLYVNRIDPAAGYAGSRVSLFGDGFDEIVSGNIVTLNGINCVVNSASSTRLDITIPEGASTGSVKVMANNSSATSPPFIVLTAKVTTIAGGDKGDGSLFNLPSDVAIDSFGNLIVADCGNHKIKKISPDGTVTTIAGSVEGDGDKFSSPGSIVIDSEGNIYVADSGNHKIKKIKPNGEIVTIAGSVKGNGNLFNTPSDIALDSLGNIFVTDSYNYVIKKISPDGNISTITSPNSNFLFNYPPLGIALTNAGNILFTSINPDVLYIKISEIPLVIRGIAAYTGFEFSTQPFGIAYKSNEIYITDLGNNAVKKISNSKVTWVAGSVKGDDYNFNQPNGIDVDKYGNVYVADQYNHKIKKISFK